MPDGKLHETPVHLFPGTECGPPSLKTEPTGKLLFESGLSAVFNPERDGRGRQKQADA